MPHRVAHVFGMLVKLWSERTQYTKELYCKSCGSWAIEPIIAQLENGNHIWTFSQLFMWGGGKESETGHDPAACNVKIIFAVVCSRLKCSKWHFYQSMKPPFVTATQRFGYGLFWKQRPVPTGSRFSFFGGRRRSTDVLSVVSLSKARCATCVP